MLTSCGDIASKNQLQQRDKLKDAAKDKTRMLDRLSLEDFSPLVGSEVDVNAYGKQARLKIKEASLIKSPSPRATEPFHLVLAAPPAWRLPQGLFRVTHPQLGEIELFAVPIGPDGESFCYEVIFN